MDKLPGLIWMQDSIKQCVNKGIKFLNSGHHQDSIMLLLKFDYFISFFFPSIATHEYIYYNNNKKERWFAEAVFVSTGTMHGHFTSF
jgi:hypothetical protein